MRFWKIRNKKTGLFSKGGNHPRWSKNGKIWTNLGHIKNHLAGVSVKHEHINDWEIVEYFTTEAGTQPVRQVLDDVQSARASRAAKMREASKRYERERKLAELERLKKELGVT